MKEGYLPCRWLLIEPAEQDDYAEPEILRMDAAALKG